MDVHKLKRLVIGLTISICSVIVLSGCSGSGGDSVPFAAMAQNVTGVAAAGSPLNGTVYLKDSANPAKEVSSPIAADGSFSINVYGLAKPLSFFRTIHPPEPLIFQEHSPTPFSRAFTHLG